MPEDVSVEEDEHVARLIAEYRPPAGAADSEPEFAFAIRRPITMPSRSMIAATSSEIRRLRAGLPGGAGCPCL